MQLGLHNLSSGYTVKPVLSGHSKKTKILAFKTDYRLMCFVLSFFQWLFLTGFTVYNDKKRLRCGCKMMTSHRQWHDIVSAIVEKISI